MLVQSAQIRSQRDRKIDAALLEQGSFKGSLKRGDTIRLIRDTIRVLFYDVGAFVIRTGLLYKRSPKVGNPIASILKSRV